MPLWVTPIISINFPVHDIVLFYSVILYIPMIYLDDLWVIPLKGTYIMGAYYIIQSGWDSVLAGNLVIGGCGRVSRLF